jgi:ubiquinone biosynthesis monooxygenase Coq7
LSGLIFDHSQLILLEKHFDGSHPSIALLKKILAEFRDDELEHLDTAVENDSQKAPAHALLSSLIGVGCKAAIEVSKRV